MKPAVRLGMSAVCLSSPEYSGNAVLMSHSGMLSPTSEISSLSIGQDSLFLSYPNIALLGPSTQPVGCKGN